MLNELDNHLQIAASKGVVAKRRLFTFNLKTRKNPRPNNKWNLNSSLEPTYLNTIAPKKEEKLASIE